MDKKVCKFEGCNKPYSALGYCQNHYRKFKKYGDPQGKYDMRGYVRLGGVKDIGKGRRGSLAVNLINDIKFKAKKRGKNWDLTHEQAFILITAECTYCGFKPVWPESRVGIDRVDNSIGYIWDNCVSCCFYCNSGKGDRTLEEFGDWIKQLYTRFVK